MSIFHDIQQLIVNDQNSIAPTLLKLRLLAAKLGSKELENWIQYESEGYPNNIDVPDYRKIPVSYIADFVGPFRAYIKNAPIPTNLIEKIAGPQWIKYNIKKSISAIEDLIFRQKAGVGIDASNLMLLLHGKVYEGYNCISATGSISVSDLVGIQNIVRHRILEFTIQLEKTIPAVTSIDFIQDKEKNKFNKKEVNQIFNQTIQVDCTVISSSGHNAKITVFVGKEDKPSLIKYLTSQNFPENEAKELADIVASEKPKSKDIPFGEKASQWIRNKLPRISEICKMTYSTTLNLVEKAISNYYGL